jgi:hypothetical protein
MVIRYGVRWLRQHYVKYAAALSVPRRGITVRSTGGRQREPQRGSGSRIYVIVLLPSLYQKQHHLPYLHPFQTYLLRNSQSGNGVSLGGISYVFKSFGICQGKSL